MRGLHASVNQLSIVDLALAEKFAAVNRDLEALTTSCSPSAWMSDGEVQRRQGLDPFGHLVMKHRKLVEERSRLILQIRLKLSGGHVTGALVMAMSALCTVNGDKSRFISQPDHDSNPRRARGDSGGGLGEGESLRLPRYPSFSSFVIC